MRDRRTRPTLSVGDIVEATAGRGSGRLFLVVRADGGEYVCISDGKTRKLENAKKKKNLHLKPVGRVEDVGFLLGKDGSADAKIRKIIKEV